MLQPNIESTENFAKLYSEYLKTAQKFGSIGWATVVDVDVKKRLVYLDAGLRKEVYLSVDEFACDGKGIGDIKKGDKFEVFIAEQPNAHGIQYLSRQKAVKVKKWKQFEECFRNGDLVYGVIIGCVKGGFAVDLNGLIGFLPGSQVDIRPVKSPSSVKHMMHTILPFGILKMDESNGNIVLSYKVVVEQQRYDQRSQYLSKIASGSIVRGRVKSIAPYGAFVDLGPLDGLLHVTDISWSKIASPAEVLSIGDEIEVVVIKYDPDAQRVSLGLKQLQDNPWEVIKDRFAAGTKHRGKVIAVADYGAFVSLDTTDDPAEKETAMKIDGLVYRFEINWLAMNAHPSRFVQVGDEVDVIVLELDVAKHRLSLSMKRCWQNPWEAFKESHPIGSNMRVYVSKILKYGVCASLSKDREECALDVFIPLAEFSWDSNANTSTEITKHCQIGQELDVLLRAVYPAKERIVCSVKALDFDILRSRVDEIQSGISFEATVSDVTDKGIFLELKNGPVGFIPKVAAKNLNLTLHEVGQVMNERVEIISIDPERPYCVICRPVDNRN